MFVVKRWLSVLICCGLAMCYGGSTASAQELTGTEKVSALEFLIAEMQSNFDKIKTWEASYKVQDHSLLTPQMMNDMYKVDRPSDSPDVSRREQGTVEFALDAGENLLYTNIEMQSRYFAEVTGDFKELSFPTMEAGLFSHRAILSPSGYISFEPNEKFPGFIELPAMDDSPLPTAFRDAVEKSEGLQQSGVVDPRLFFGINEQTFFWTDLQNTIDWGMLDSIKVYSDPREQGKRYVIKLGESSGGNNDVSFVGVYTFNENDSYNPSEFSFEKRHGRSIAVVKVWNWRYTEIDGIHIPEYIRCATHSDDDLYVKSERILELKECSLNKKIDPQKFTYAGLGLKNGERVVDRIEGVGMIMRDGKPTVVAKFGDPVALVSRQTWSWPRIIGILVFVLAIGAACCWSFIRRRGQAENRV